MSNTVAGPNVYSLSLGPHPGAVPLARMRLEDRLREWNMAELFPDAAVITSELVSNAARLGEDFELELRAEGEALMIRVTDGSTAEPVVNPDPLADLENDDTDDNGGRGLVLVEAYADEWDYDLYLYGKTVWARLRRT